MIELNAAQQLLYISLMGLAILVLWGYVYPNFMKDLAVRRMASYAETLVTISEDEEAQHEARVAANSLLALGVINLKIQEEKTAIDLWLHLLRPTTKTESDEGEVDGQSWFTDLRDECILKVEDEGMRIKLLSLYGFVGLESMLVVIFPSLVTSILFWVAVAIALVAILLVVTWESIKFVFTAMGRGLVNAVHGLDQSWATVATVAGSLYMKIAGAVIKATSNIHPHHLA